MARKKLHDVQIPVRFALDLLARIDAVRGSTTRTEWIRQAVEAAVEPKEPTQ